jgi:cbb3-type cytochrome oxidase subunit 3
MTNSQLQPRIPATLLLWIAGLVYAALYLVFRPHINAIMDESAYLSAAYAIRHGTFYLDIAGVTSIFSYPVGAHVVNQYPPGMPALIAAISVLGWPAVQMLNLAVQLLIFASLTQILRRLKLSPLWAVLYLFHPTAVIYSRTVMSDLPSSLLITVAFLCYLRRRFALSGALIGLAAIVRTANAITLPLFMLGLLLDNDGWDAVTDAAATAPSLALRIRSAIVMGISAFPLVLGAWLYQAIVQQGGWKKYSSGGQFGPHNFPHVFPHYAFALFVLYPGMILAPAFYRGSNRWTIRCLSYGIVLFYSCYFFSDATASALESFIIGQRYMLTVLPLFIVAYGAAVERLSVRVPSTLRRSALAVAAALLLAGAAAVHEKHQHYLDSGARIQRTLLATIGPDDTLVCNIHVATLLPPLMPGGKRHVLLFGLTPKATLQEITDAAIARPGGRIFVADWNRDYRAESGLEVAIIDTIEERFPHHALNGTLDPLSADFDVFMLDR